MKGIDSHARIGLIVPSSNTVAEVDFYRGVQPSMTVHTARMHLEETTVAGERAMLETYLPQAVADIASARPDVVAFACTSAGALLAAEGEADLIGRLHESCQCPVVSTNDAVGTCIERRSARQVAVITPYVDELNERIRSGLVRRGLDVVKVAGMGMTENFAIARVAPEEIVVFAMESLRGERFDLLFVSCTNLRGLEARPALEARLQVPVVTSNQATLERTLEELEGSRRSAGRIA